MQGRAVFRLAPALVLLVAACAPVATGPQPPPPAYQQAPRDLGKADFLRVRKSQRLLEVWSQGRLMMTIPGLQLGFAPVGAKQFEGDGRTPEGRYLIDWRNPHSAYHLSLHISYPNGAQVLHARGQGRTAGGLIMIHGQPNGYEGRAGGDWTDGCIALSNTQIETLWDIVPDGTVIEIVP